MTTTLYEISEQYRQLLEMLEDPEIDQDIVRDTLEGLEGELEVKAESCIIVSKRLEADADMVSKEIERLTKVKDSLTNNAKKIEESVMQTMVAAGKDKLPTKHFKLSIAKNGGLQPLKLADISEIPEEYIIREPKADTKKIRDALNSGKPLNFAYLEERGVHLNVR